MSKEHMRMIEEIHAAVVRPATDQQKLVEAARKVIEEYRKPNCKYRSGIQDAIGELETLLEKEAK